MSFPVEKPILAMPIRDLPILYRPNTSEIQLHNLQKIQATWRLGNDMPTDDAGGGTEAS